MNDMDAKTLLTKVRTIIAYGAMPETLEPIGMKELSMKANAECITEDELGAALKALSATNEITSPKPGIFVLVRKGS